MLPPGLHRAISDCTSPFGPYPAAEVLRKLEIYLADPRSTDAVYESLVNRACAQPLSTPLVEKVLGLLKAYLLRFTPSVEVVQLLEEFSYRAQHVAGLSPAGSSAVHYVRSCLRKLRGDRPGAARSSRGSSSSLVGNGGGGLCGSWGRSRDDLTRLGPDGRLSSVKVNVPHSAPGRTNDRYAAADALPSPTDPDAAAGVLPPWLRQSDSVGVRGWEDLRLPSPQQAALGLEPAWAVPCRPTQLPPPAATAARAALWMQHLPELAPRVTLAALPAALAAGGGRMLTGSHSAPGTMSGALPIKLATIHRCVLDLEEQDIGRHLAEMLGEARMEAQQQQSGPQQRQQPSSRAGGRAGGAHGAAARDGGGGGRRVRPTRLLFHHPPYNRSEQLPMVESDVAVVVEAVCGVRAASALAAVQGPPGAGAESSGGTAGFGQPEGVWQAAFEEDPDFGQMCGSILMKLIMDLWTRCGAVGSYLLVLRMLRASLRSGQPATRARSFDVLYNLSIHGAMLRSEAEEAALAAAAADASGGVGGMQMPWQVCASAPVSPFMSVGGGATPTLAQRSVPQPTTTTAAATTATATTANGTAETPGAAPVGAHSLGLAGSTILDTSGSLTATATGQQAAKAAAANGAAGDGSDAPSIADAGSGGGGGEGQQRKDGGSGDPPALSSPPSSPKNKVPALGGAAAGSAGERGAAAGYDRWLRSLVFQLLCDISESNEYTEEVWRAAMGCVTHVCTRGGYWVTDWVMHLPPPALAGLLRAACQLGWSQELYGHLLKLVPAVLVRPPTPTPTPPPPKRSYSAFAAPAALNSAAAAAAGDAVALAAAAAPAAAGMEASETAAHLAAFGGLEELLYHFNRAPTPDSRASLLTALVYCCGGSGGEAASAGGSVCSSGTRSPRTSSSPGGRGLADAGPGAVLGVLQGLHLDSVCLALRAALLRPWPSMSSRLADVLASACATIDLPATSYPLVGAAPSPSASISGSADYAGHSLPAGVASPIAVRALLRPLLESLERCCADSMMTPQDGALRTHIDVSIGHVLGPAADSDLFPPAAVLSEGCVAAAWQTFKDACSEESADARLLAVHWLHRLLSAACRACQGQILLLSPLSLKSFQDDSRFASSNIPGPGPGAAQAPSPPLPRWNTALADALLHVVREAPLGCELLMAAISRVAADTKALLTAEDGVAGAPLSPRPTLPIGGGGRAAATTVDSVVGGEEPALVACRRVMWWYYVGLQWMQQCPQAEARMPSVIEMADTMLLALLQPDPTAVAAGQQLAPVGSIGPGAQTGGMGMGLGMGNVHGPGGMQGLEKTMSVVGGSAYARTRNNTGTANPNGRTLATAGSSGSSISTQPYAAYPQHLQHPHQPQHFQPHLQQQHLPQHAHMGSMGQTTGQSPYHQPSYHQQPPYTNQQPTPPYNQQQAYNQQQHPTQFQTTPQHVTNQQQQQSGGMLHAPQEPGGGMLISQQLLSGLLALDPDALACTPPELLVILLQQCSQSLQDAGSRATLNPSSGFPSMGGAAVEDVGGGDAAARSEYGGYRSMRRGFVGRPCAVEDMAAYGGGRGSTAAAVAVAGVRGVCGVSAVGMGMGGEVLALSGAAVGPWQDDWQDRRLALLLLLMARCSLDPEAFAKYSLSHVIKAQLSCEDLRCRYYAGVYLLKHWMLNQHDRYWRTLRHIIGTAQQLNDERLLDNPYLQMRTMLNVDHA